MARPHKDPDDLRSESMKLPMTQADKELIQEAAELAGERPVPWAREAILRAAKRVIRQAKH